MGGTELVKQPPSTEGRAIIAGGAKLDLCGATYGTFGADGSEYPDAALVDRDFAAMAAAGLNSVRTYTVPPRWLLDLAHEHALRVMIGIPWEQHVCFLDDRRRVASIADRVRAAVRPSAGHPAVLCYAVGNEIPAPIVRWYGPQRIERFLERLYRAAKSESPEALVTYVNYPSTEYLELPFLDLVAFNVFLESEETFAAYVGRLQNLAGDRPFLVTEAGLDSRRHGTETQARTVSWQVRRSFAAGAAGVFVFSWTDEWHRGGEEIVDWDFGLTDRRRRPKAALGAVREAARSVPFGSDREWPRVSVVVCTHNGAPTLPQCLERLARLRYPDYEVIVVSDGSTDATNDLVEGFPELDATLVRIEHQGLAAARNIGMERASGEIVAYIDDDAYPDPDWLRYLAAAFADSSHAAIGGPNIPPPDEPLVARCVASAPGGPVHVLVSDTEAEHIPGCNMAIRRHALREIGGFDPQFRIAGDDVDICWRLQDAGHTVGFSPGAVVLHRRRPSIRRYLRQQYQYGKAEALLERKWPHRYNRGGYLSWAGRVYGNGAPGNGRGKIHYGRWGTGLFQSVYAPAASVRAALPFMPETYLVIAALTVISALGVVWSPLLAAVPLVALAVGGLLWSAVQSRGATHGAARERRAADRLTARLLTASLHTLQPLARLAGRLLHGLAPWRRRAGSGRRLPLPRTVVLWSETWRPHESRVEAIEARLIETGAVVRHGTAFDRWDLEVHAGLLGGARVRTAIEEYGRGRQLLRARAWPQLSIGGAVFALALAAVAVMAAGDGATAVAVLLAIGALSVVVCAARDTSAAMATMLDALERYRRQLEAADLRPAGDGEARGIVERIAPPPAALRVLAPAANGNGAHAVMTANGHEAARFAAGEEETV